MVLTRQCIRAPGEGLIKCRTGSTPRVSDSAGGVGPQNLHSPTSQRMTILLNSTSRTTGLENGKAESA